MDEEPKRALDESHAVGYRDGREAARAEIERLAAERDLWKARAERMFWLLPDDVKVAQIQDQPIGNEQSTPPEKEKSIDELQREWRDRWPNRS